MRHCGEPFLQWGRRRRQGRRTRRSSKFRDKLLARVTGLEPATSGVTGRRSNQLSYTRSRQVADLSPGLSAVKQGVDESPRVAHVLPTLLGVAYTIYESMTLTSRLTARNMHSVTGAERRRSRPSRPVALPLHERWNRRG